jgi:hypothetical protein
VILVMALLPRGAAEALFWTTELPKRIRRVHSSSTPQRLEAQ